MLDMMLLGKLLISFTSVPDAINDQPLGCAFNVEEGDNPEVCYKTETLVSNNFEMVNVAK